MCTILPLSCSEPWQRDIISFEHSDEFRQNNQNNTLDMCLERGDDYNFDRMGVVNEEMRNNDQLFFTDNLNFVKNTDDIPLVMSGCTVQNNRLQQEFSPQENQFIGNHQFNIVDKFDISDKLITENNNYQFNNNNQLYSNHIDSSKTLKADEHFFESVFNDYKQTCKNYFEKIGNKSVCDVNNGNKNSAKDDVDNDIFNVTYDNNQPIFIENETKSTPNEFKCNEDEPILSEIPPIFDEKKPILNENKPIFSGGKSIFSEDKHTFSANKGIFNKSTFNEKNLTLSVNKPVFNIIKPIFSENKFIFNENKPTTKDNFYENIFDITYNDQLINTYPSLCARKRPRSKKQNYYIENDNENIRFDSTYNMQRIDELSLDEFDNDNTNSHKTTKNYNKKKQATPFKHKSKKGK